MGIATVLRALRLLPPEPAEDVDDQTYSEAVMDNAMRESDRTISRLKEVAANGARSNARLTESIERLAMSNVDKADVMADLVRGMKSR
jgi:hypothetical protein